MKTLELQKAFGLDNLVFSERPDATPGPDEIVIRMKSSSLNYRDLLMIKGMYNPRLKFPLIPFSDGCGVVEQSGEKSGYKPGDRVAPIFAQNWLYGPPGADTSRFTLGGPLDGCARETMVLPSSGVVAVPAHLSDVEASALPCAGLTAWSALSSHGGSLAGATVVALGTGGVSIFALQFAKMMGARVIVTSSDDEKLEKALRLGADEGINYRQKPDWDKEVKRLTGGEGADHIIEVGGAGTLEKSIRAVRPGGCVSLIGILAGVSKDLDLRPILMRNIRVQGILVGHRQGFEEMNRAVDAHRLRPVIDRVFPFQESKEALEHLASGSHFGKVCIQI